MLLQKRQSTLILACVVVIIGLIISLQHKSRAMSALSHEMNGFAEKQQVVTSIKERANMITLYREMNKRDCEYLGQEIPYSLVRVCGKPE